jgi:hypothetical protein
MPAVSDKQERFMQAVANNPKFAKKAGVPQSVGREFTKGDKMKCGSKKMAMGGMAKDVKPKDRMPAPQSDKELDKISPEARKMMEQKRKDMAQEKSQKSIEKKYARGGGIEHKGKTKGTMVKMANGGMVGKASKRADGIATKGKTKCKVM